MSREFHMIDKTFIFSVHTSILFIHHWFIRPYLWESWKKNHSFKEFYFCRYTCTDSNEDLTFTNLLYTIKYNNIILGKIEVLTPEFYCKDDEKRITYIFQGFLTRKIKAVEVIIEVRLSVRSSVTRLCFINRDGLLIFSPIM